MKHCADSARPRSAVPVFRARPVCLALVAGAAIFSPGPSANAATKYWEPTGTTGTAASGTWNTSSAVWNTDSTAANATLTTFNNSASTGTYSTGTVTGTYTYTVGDDAVFSDDPSATGPSSVTTTTLTVNSLTFGNAGVTGGAAGGYTFSNGGTLTVGGYAVSGANTYTGNAAITLNSGAGPVTFNGLVNLANSLPDAAGSSTLNYSLVNNSSSTLTFNGAFGASTRPANTNDTFNVTLNTGGVTFNGAIQGNNASNTAVGGQLNFSIGGATVAMNGVSNVGGKVSLSSGSLTLGNTLALQTLALNQTGGTFSFGTLTAAQIEGLTGNTSLVLTNTGNTGVNLTLAGYAFTNSIGGAPSPTFSGNISGLGGLTISGVQGGNRSNGGLATFSGVLSFTGASGFTVSDAILVGSPYSNQGSGGIGNTSGVLLTNANTYTGPTTVTLPGGNFTLNGNGSITGTSAITLNGGLVTGTTTVGGTTLVYDNTVNGTVSRLGTAPITLNGSTLNYKAVTTGTNTAGTGSAGAITVSGAQASAFTFAAATGTGNTSNFTIASLANSNHGTLTAFLPGANLSTDFVTVTTAPALINGILPWTYETSNGNFLSVNASSQLNAFNNVGTDVVAFNNTATSNVKITASQAALAAATAENSLIYSAPATQGFGGNALTLTSGGLVLGNASAILGSSANDGSLTTAAANPELYVNTTANATINAAITNAAGGTSVALTKFGTGTLSLAGTNTYSGPTTVEQGTLAITSGGIANSATTLNAGTTLTNLGTLGALTINNGASATLYGTSVTGAITENGTLTIPAATAMFTAGSISGTGGTGVINYQNVAPAGNTLNFAAGANSFLGVNNIGNSSLLLLTGVGSTNTFSQGFSNNGANATSTTIFQSGTYTFPTGTQQQSTNQFGNFQVAGGTVILQGGLRFGESAGGTITVASGVLQNQGQFDTEDQTGNTTITYNVTGGLFDQYGQAQNFALGNGGAPTTSNTASINVSGGIYQSGVTNNSSQTLNIGTNVANTHATFALSGTGIVRFNGTLAAANAPAATGSNQLNLTGGTLTATAINLTNLGSNDGTNSAITGTLYNGGTTLAPGYFGQALGAVVGSANAQFTGRTTITGIYQVDSPKAGLAINLGGTTSAGGFGVTAADYDNLVVTGTANLGTTSAGRLSLGLINSYTPPSNVTTLYNVVTASTALSGTFSNLVTGNSATTAGGGSRVVLANGLSSMLVGINTTAAAATTGGLTAVPARTVSLGGYQATNTYNAANGNAWDAASAANWTNFDPGSTSAPATQSSGAVAQFADGGTVNNTGTGAVGVTLNSTRNIQGIQFSSAVANHNYTINDAGNGTGAIILDNTANGAAATIADSSASGNANAVNVPITLNSPLAVSVTNAANTLTLGGAIGGAQTVTKTGLGTLILSGTNTYSGTTTIGNNAGIVEITNVAALGTGGVALTTTNGTTSQGTLQLAFTGGTPAAPNVIANNITGNSQNTFTSGTPGFADIENVSGSNQLSGTYTLTGTGGTGQNIVADAGSNLELAGGLTINGPTGTRGFDFGGAGNIVVSGVYSTGTATAAQLQKDGTGTLTLTAANTYNGTTQVNAGALLVNGSVGSVAPGGIVTVASSGTLGGSGMLRVASATVNGTLAPGAALGAVTGALTLNTINGLTINGTLLVGVSPTSGGGNTVLNTSGALTLGGSSTLTLSNALDGVSNYDIANYGTLAGTFTNFTVPAGYSINYMGTSFVTSGDDIELDVTAVPEPSTWLCGVLMAGATGLHLRRRRARNN